MRQDRRACIGGSLPDTEECPGFAGTLPSAGAWGPFEAPKGGQMGRLDGKVALISGGARGQGAVEARLFVREGAAVVFGDVLDDDGKKIEAAIRASGGRDHVRYA